MASALGAFGVRRDRRFSKYAEDAAWGAVEENFTAVTSAATN
jgi:hypothetical protein